MPEHTQNIQYRYVGYLDRSGVNADLLLFKPRPPMRFLVYMYYTHSIY